jgi:hypothetical protein
MKLYSLNRSFDSVLHLLCEAQTKSGVVSEAPAGKFDIGNASKETKALALAIMSHYYGTDPAAQAEAQRKAQPFMNAFLISHSMPPGAKYEIPDSVIDRFFSLNQPA